MSGGKQLQQALTAVEIGSAFGMLILTIICYIYVLRSKNRVWSGINSVIYITLIIAFIFQATLSIYNYHGRKNGGISEEN